MKGLHFAAAVPFAISCISDASTLSAQEFYQGRQISIIVYSTPGSANDNYARFLARHMGRRIAGNPSFIVQNMPGAGGLKAAEYMFKVAPKDGTAIGFISRGLPFDPILGKNEIKFDPVDFVWLGSMNRVTTVAFSWHTSKIKTYEDLQQHELLVGGTGSGADSEIVPLAMNAFARTKFKIVSGYSGSAESAIAMERGELEGFGTYSWESIKLTKPEWIRDKKINIFYHAGVAPPKDLPDVRGIRTLVKDATSRQALDFILARDIIAVPAIAPPGIPQERAKVLIDAFSATLTDPAVLKDADETKLEVNLVTADEVTTLLKQTAATPKELIHRIKKAIGSE